MKCPKCGQEMIHINNQHICTVCGIVANEFSPKDQVLNQIRAKVKAQTAQNTPKEEEYISPVAVAKEKNEVIDRTEAAKKYIVQPTPMSDKTLDQMARALMVNQNSKVESSETENGEEVGAEKVIPRIVETSPEEGSSIQTAAVSQPNLDVQNSEASILQENVVKEKNTEEFIMPESGKTDFTVEPAPASSQMVYPSHQVNPILMKILIGLIVLMIFLVICYIIYANFRGARGLIDGIIQYLGLNFFK